MPTTTSPQNTQDPPTESIAWHRLDTPDDVARAARQLILGAAHNAMGAHGRFRIVLAGGTTPERVYRGLVDADTDWSNWHIYFGDERCLAADHPQRNSVIAAKSWLNHVPIPPAQIHPIPAEQGAEAAALAYTAVVRAALPFDLVLLGMGEDGHTASLFPGQRHHPSELVHAIHHAPKPPPDRVSLSRCALGDSSQVLFLVTGAGKRDALQRWQAGEALPVSEIAGHCGTDVLLDAAAAPVPATDRRGIL